MSYPRRSKEIITYHGRKGKPTIHQAKSGRLFIIVRAPKGKGVRRLYAGSRYTDDGKTKVLSLS